MPDRFYSPLRYPGGKGKVANYFSKLFIDNNLDGGTYVEPYVGGGSVALSLLFNVLASHIIINDRDRSLYAFWHSVLYQTEDLCRLINDTPVNIEHWLRQKEIQRQKVNVDLLELGFSTFYLNRTNRSGILNGGIIGGMEQTGRFLIDARYTKPTLISRIQRIAQYVNQIQLYGIDAVELVKQLKIQLNEKTLFYFDPPYYIKGKGLYMNYYTDNDHQEIANEISSIQDQKWVVSYDFVPFIAKLYSHYRTRPFDLNYSAAKVGKGKELMIFSPNIKISKDNLLGNEKFFNG